MYTKTYGTGVAAATIATEFSLLIDGSGLVSSTVAGGTITISGFSPTGVTCSAGYTGSVSYTVCGSAGSAYSVLALPNLRQTG